MAAQLRAQQCARRIWARLQRCTCAQRAMRACCEAVPCSWSLHFAMQYTALEEERAPLGVAPTAAVSSSTRFMRSRLPHSGMRAAFADSSKRCKCLSSMYAFPSMTIAVSNTPWPRWTM